MLYLTKRLFGTTVLLLLPFVFMGCLDQVTSKYKTYSLAKEDSLFIKGWIPDVVIYPSMTNIYLQNNIDTNGSIFQFNLSKEELKDLEGKLKISQAVYQDKYDITEPRHWEREVNKCLKYSLTKSKTLIALNYEERTVYGWSIK